MSKIFSLWKAKVFVANQSTGKLDLRLGVWKLCKQATFYDHVNLAKDIMCTSIQETTCQYMDNL